MASKKKRKGSDFYLPTQPAEPNRGSLASSFLRAVDLQTRQPQARSKEAIGSDGQISARRLNQITYVEGARRRRQT